MRNDMTWMLEKCVSRADTGKVGVSEIHRVLWTCNTIIPCDRLN